MPSASVPDVIMPFPGGIVRSGSKVGSKYKGAVASTNDAFCPTLRGRVKSELGARHRRRARDRHRRADLASRSPTPCAPASRPLIDIGAAKGVTRVTAGNYGGKLGPHHYQAAGAAAMSGLTFRLRAAPAERLDLSQLTPKRLSSTPLAEVLKFVVGSTKSALTVGDVFAVSGKPGDTVRIEGGSAPPRLRRRRARPRHGHRRGRRRRCRGPQHARRPPGDQRRCRRAARLRHQRRPDCRQGLGRPSPAASAPATSSA